MTEISGGKIYGLLEELVTRPSENPPGREKAVAEYLVERIESSPVPFGIEVSRVEPDRPNVIARAGDPSKGSVLLTGHTDVVPAKAADWSGDPYDLNERDGRLIGRGVSDMKGGLAAELCAAESFFQDAEESGEVILAFVVGEETGGAGMANLVREGIDADAAILGEPTEMNICTAQKGALFFELVVRGCAAHSSQPQNGVNAIETLCGIVAQLEELTSSNTTGGNIGGEAFWTETVAATEIEGGETHNVVPDHASTTIDWRIPPSKQEYPEDYRRRVEQFLAQIGDPTDGEIEWESIQYTKPAQISPQEPIVTALSSATSDFGVDGRLTGFNAGTDARILINRGHIPTALFGPGSIKSDAHTVDESVAFDDLVLASKVYRKALENFFEQSP